MDAELSALLGGLGGVLSLSGKDMFTATQLLEMAEARKSDLGAEEACENFWELALKLRGDAAHAHEVLKLGCVKKMASVANQEHRGG